MKTNFITFLVFATASSLGSAQTAFAQPADNRDAPPTIKFPSTAPLTPASSSPLPAPTEMSVPPNLQGIVSPSEFYTYITFQQQLRNDQSIRELNDKIMVHVQELQKLQLQLNALREKALAGNQEAKAIGDRIQQALSLARKTSRRTSALSNLGRPVFERLKRGSRLMFNFP